MKFFHILCNKPSRWIQKFAVGVTKLMPPDEIRRFDGTTCTSDPEWSLPQGLLTLEVDQAEVQNLCVLCTTCTSDPEWSLPQGLLTLEVDQAEVQNLCVLCAPLTQRWVCLRDSTHWRWIRLRYRTFVYYNTVPVYYVHLWPKVESASGTPHTGGGPGWGTEPMCPGYFVHLYPQWSLSLFI